MGYSIYKILKRLCVLSAHPVGEIYMTLDNDFDPNILWGGSWEKIEDRFLVGAGHTYALESTGGEATHTLNLNEMPSHTHMTDIHFSWNNSSKNTVAGAATQTNGYLHVDDNSSNVGYRYNTSDSKGGNQPHNNLPPYLAVNIWKRTA